MKACYRLCSSRYPPNNGKGAARYGGRWNPVGLEAIYTSDSPSMAALEILVHYSVLPLDFVLTRIELPVSAPVLTLTKDDLPSDWNDPLVHDETQSLGERWIRENKHLVLDVPSAVVPLQRSLILNPAHPDFPAVKFLPPVPFHFDPRLK